MAASLFFGGSGHEVCSCGAWVKATHPVPLCEHIVCRWCEEAHEEECIDKMEVERIVMTDTNMELFLKALDEIKGVIKIDSQKENVSEQTLTLMKIYDIVEEVEKNLDYPVAEK